MVQTCFIVVLVFCFCQRVFDLFLHAVSNSACRHWAGSCEQKEFLSYVFQNLPKDSAGDEVGRNHSIPSCGRFSVNGSCGCTRVACV